MADILRHLQAVAWCLGIAAALLLIGIFIYHESTHRRRP